MTWLDWLRIGAIFIAFCAIGTGALIVMFLICFRPLGSGPERIVDVRNRGETRIRMPDGSIK